MKIIHGLKENQVLQRKGKKGARLILTGECSNQGPVSATLYLKQKALPRFKDISSGQVKQGRFRIQLKGIPAGGPYALHLSCGKETLQVKKFYCGDVWVLAGQSNMEGVGLMSGAARPHPSIQSFSMRRE